MGYSLSWAAIKNGKPEAIHSLLGLRPTEVWVRIHESKTVGANLPTGWYLVSFKRKELGADILTKLSSMAEVVYCFVEDHVMFSRASGWKDGKFLWSVTHDREKGIYHLEIKGDAPLSQMRRGETKLMLTIFTTRRQNLPKTSPASAMIRTCRE